ncbi:MAG: DUF1559 domain-containing protein [Gemmataceae bacterium]|nr:DUF1559 domain-containing protein [Gemmataceae bacterium]
MPGRTRLAVLSVPLLAAALLARPDEPKPARPAPAEPIASLSVDLAKVWDHKAFAPVREAPGSVELAWAVRSLIGFAPAEVDRLVVTWTAPDEVVAVVTTRKPHDAAAVVKELPRDANAQVKTLPGGVLHAPGAEFAYARRLDDKTLLLATAACDPNGLASHTRPEPADKHALSVYLGPKAVAGLPVSLGRPLADFAATLTADLGEETAKLTLTATYADAEKAKAAAPQLRARLDDLAGWAKGQEKQAAERAAAGESSAYPSPLLDWLATTLKAAKVTADGTSAVAAVEVKPEELVGRVLMAVPDSAFAGRGSTANENNLKQIALAFHNYESAFGNFPSNSYDKDGKPLLSWRVHILPFVEQDALYKQFKLDEPWDGDHNKPLGDILVKLYMVPGRPADAPNKTYYRAFISPKDVKPEYRALMVEGELKGPKIVAIPDGSSNTIMVVEAGEAVPWAKPDDLPYDGVLPLPRLGGPNGTFAVALCDGSVRTFRRAKLNEATLRGAITIQGGEVINFP